MARKLFRVRSAGKRLDSPPVIAIAPRTVLVDLEYLGSPGHIGACVLETPEGLAIVDPGPGVTLPRLRQGLLDLGATLQDVRIVLVTHIHLDHAGVIGALARTVPSLRVFVHDVGGPHLADPARLLRSATMIYGEEHMDRLWGEMLPVPADRIVTIGDTARLNFGGRVVRAAATPGHARHHLAWFDEESGIAFTGDVVGEQFPEAPGRAFPVTPPPDIDVPLMVASGRRILAWQPARLLPTHFGPAEDPAAFVAEHEVRLVHWSELVRRSLRVHRSDAELAAEHAAVVRAEFESLLPATAHGHLRDDMLMSNWDGLARYWRRAAATSR
jgi:glyoxylase-like metal-dependent hydrolase (beta-lactamase superfamily II)